MIARFAEGLLDERAVRKKYRLAESDWEALGNDEKLIEAIELERVRRVRDGSSKRERAQQLVVKAPDVLGGIMLDASASPRHRVDAIRLAAAGESIEALGKYCNQPFYRRSS